jgi:lipoprotein-releasing system permease protein
VELAARLGLSLGSELSILRPAREISGGLTVKRTGHFVSGIIQTGLPQHDGSLIVMNLGAAQHLLGQGDLATRIALRTADADQAGELLTPLMEKLRGVAKVQTWREMNKSVFDALALEQVGMFIALSIIVLVALFNILSSLVMLVRSKLRDIAIMRTMGATEASIAKIFVAVGTAIGSSGAALGSLLGFSLVSFKEEIAGFIKQYVLGDSYTKEVAVLIDLPAHISIGEGAGIVAMALVGTVLATLYPAFRAAAVDPASVLRYD